MTNLTANESRNKRTAKSTGGLVAGVVAPLRFRRQAATVVIVLASTVWIAGLAALGYAQSGLPWCITLAVTACGAILSGNKSQVRVMPRAVQSADHQPVSFVEAYALTYMAVSVALCAWIVYHLLCKPPPLTVKRQAVDIELMSLADFRDRQDPLPGTQEKAALRKRTADLITSHGTLSPQLAPQAVAPKPQPARADGSDNQRVKAESDKQVMKNPQINDARMVIMQPLESVTSPIAATNPIATPLPLPVAKHLTPTEQSPQARNQPQDEPLLEEVKPPEMVELVDNDGDSSLDVWQAGGHSAGGAGAKSPLIAYLKELNKRIKTAWQPPRGDPWKTEVLFRIKKTGQLVSARVTQSSGSQEADVAAIKAIAASSPFRKLPPDYPHDYLDLQYSFNYNVDQLTEVNDGLPH